MKHTTNKLTVKPLPPSTFPPSPTPIEDAPLSPYWAFVVHFRTSTAIEAGQISGRVEHVISGHSTHFASLDELVAFMARELERLAAPDKGGSGP